MVRTGKRVFVGFESGGKSLLMARESYQNLFRNARWLKITGIPRPIVGNLPWSKEFHALADKLGIPILPFKHISQLPTLSECDLYLDELGTYFDSRLFADLPLDVRLWLGQAEKMGVQMVGTAQDFGQVDKSFRRLCKEVFEVKKIVGSRRPMKTAPPVNWIWGVLLVWELEPRSFQGEQVDMKTLGLPSPFLIRKKWIRLFDTSARIALSDPAPLMHVERKCQDPLCRYHHRGLIKHI